MGKSSSRSCWLGGIPDTCSLWSGEGGVLRNFMVSMSVFIPSHSESCLLDCRPPSGAGSGSETALRDRRGFIVCCRARFFAGVLPR